VESLHSMKTFPKGRMEGQGKDMRDMAVDRENRPDQFDSRIIPIVMLMSDPNTSTHTVDRIVFSQER